MTCSLGGEFNIFVAFLTGDCFGSESDTFSFFVSFDQIPYSLCSTFWLVIASSLDQFAL